MKSLTFEGKLYFKGEKSYPTPYINLLVDRPTKKALKKLHRKKIIIKIVALVEEKPKKIKILVGT